ncbi:MAG: efflux RND transporter periplasmic adaptor subunit [Burkholderiales bacterium]|nr:efflux RND transporter periplasmic adaptor subunit [Burkholderiales bacterium]
MSNNNTFDTTSTSTPVGTGELTTTPGGGQAGGAAIHPSSTHSSPAKPVVLAVAMLVIGLAVGWGVSRWQAGQGAATSAHGTAAASLPAGAQVALAGAAGGERKVLYWYDPMVPTQKFDKPGKSPFMDMQLVPRYADEAGAGAGGADEGPSLGVSTAARQALGLRLATVEQRALGAAVELVGTVQLSERDISIVQARSSGYVERVYARAPGDVIAAGAPLVDVLNPDWLAAQQEYFALEATGDAALTKAARQRLVLLGMPADMIDAADRSGQPMALQTIKAPGGGVISELMVRPGMMLAPGMTLARINGLGTVWLEAALPEALAATLQPGQAVEARFPALPGQVVKGKVAAVLSEADRETRTLRLRIELPNPGQRLKAGLFAQVTLRGTQRDALVLPAEAVIRTGKRAIVYIAEVDAKTGAPSGRFRPVEVDIGEQVGEQLEIRRGLAAGQQVVASGQFLIDSEASMQGVMARSQNEPAGAGTATASPAPTSTASAAVPKPEKTLAGASAAAAAHDHGVATPPSTTPAAAPGVGSKAVPTAAAVPDYGTRGVVTGVEPGEITLEHEPVPALKWPGMEMPFKVIDQKLLRGMKPGEKVDFRFIQRGDDWVITRITPAAAGTGASK